jgi:hypothetical protein
MKKLLFIITSSLLFSFNYADPIIKQFTNIVDNYGWKWNLTVMSLDGNFPGTSLVIDGSGMYNPFDLMGQQATIDLVKNGIALNPATMNESGIITLTMPNQNQYYTEVKVNTIASYNYIYIGTSVFGSNPSRDKLIGMTFHVVYQ